MILARSYGIGRRAAMTNLGGVYLGLGPIAERSMLAGFLQQNKCIRRTPQTIEQGREVCWCRAYAGCADSVVSAVSAASVMTSG